MKFEEFLSDDVRQKIIFNSLQPKVILHIHSCSITPPGDKFCIIVNKDPLAVFYINSKINSFILKRPELSRLQIPLSPSEDYQFLDRVSYINCANLDFGLKLEVIIKQMTSKPEYYAIKGFLSSKEIQKIITVVTNSNIYSPV